MLLQPFQEFALNLIRPLAIDLAGAVLSGTHHFKTELVFSDHEFGHAHHLLCHVGWHKEHAFHRRDHQVARENDRLADTNGRVKTHQHHLFSERRVEVAHKCVEPYYVADLLQISRGAIEHDTVSGFGINGISPRSPHNAASADLTKGIRYVKVALGENINRPGVGVPLPALFRSAFLDVPLYIG